MLSFSIACIIRKLKLILVFAEYDFSFCSSVKALASVGFMLKLVTLSGCVFIAPLSIVLSMKINNLLSLLNNNTAFLFTSTQKNVIIYWTFKNKKQFLNSLLEKRMTIIVIAEKQFTRPNNTTTYASGDLVADSATAASVTPIAFDLGKVVYNNCFIRRARLFSSSANVTNAATAAVGKEGEADYVPAQPQVGHPDYWYTCIRSDTAIELPSGIEPCSVEEGSSVVGVWA